MIFTSQRPLERAENIKTLFDAYDGEKEFRQMNLSRNGREETSTTQYPQALTIVI